MAKKTLSIIVVDDEKLILKCISSVLDSHKEIKVVGEALSAEECYRMFDELDPDMVLMDICLKKTNGFEVMKNLRKRKPSCKFLMMSSLRKKLIESAIDNGANGFISKSSGPKEMFTAITEISNGNTYIPSFFSNEKNKNSLVRLSKRERQITLKIREEPSLSTKELAAMFGISVNTMYSHKKHIFDKIGVCNTYELSRRLN